MLGFNSNVKEWSAKGQTYQTLAICPHARPVDRQRLYFSTAAGSAPDAAKERLLRAVILRAARSARFEA
jgi:hypothetical protein